MRSARKASSRTRSTRSPASAPSRRVRSGSPRHPKRQVRLARPSSRFGCGKTLLVIIGVIVVIGIIAAVAASGGDDNSGSTTSSRPAPTATKTVREKIEDCLSPLDGNHNGFEDQIRPLLNDEGSMRTHDTYFGTERGALGGSQNEVGIRMVYSAENAFGARIKKEAVGRLNFESCQVTVITTGLE